MKAALFKRADYSEYRSFWTVKDVHYSGTVCSFCVHASERVSCGSEICLLWAVWFCHVLPWRHMEAIWVMQLVTAGGTGRDASARQVARASIACFGLLGDRS